MKKHWETAPVIGIVHTRIIKGFSTTPGHDDIEIPGASYEVVMMAKEEGGKLLYITNITYKERGDHAEPLCIHEDLVERYEELV